MPATPASRIGLFLLGIFLALPLYAAQAERAPEALRSGDYGALERQFSAVQAAYESGKLDDEPLRAAFRVFYDTDRSLEPRYAAWVAQHPRSYVAHLAMGIYYKRLGQQVRGEAAARDTSPEQFAAMRQAFDRAVRAFARSESLTAKPLLTYLHAMDIPLYAGDHAATRAFLDKALQIDPASFIVREKYMGTLQRKWGGSPERMQAFLEESQRAGLSRSDLAQLKAVIQLDQAWTAQFVEQDARKAASLYVSASRRSRNPACRECAAFALLDAGDYEGAIRSFSRSLGNTPGDARLLYGRGWAYLMVHQDQAALADIRAAAERGNADAQDLLARGHLLGTFAPLDRERGIQWLERAAAQGHAEAQALLPHARDRNLQLLPQP